MLEQPQEVRLDPQFLQTTPVEPADRDSAEGREPTGTLLVLDDLQWAGVDALDLLAVLARGAGGRLRIVGGYRDTDVMPSDALAVLVGDLAQAGLVQQLSLGPLSGREATALLDDLLVGSVGTDDAVAEHVLQRAGELLFSD